MVGNILRLLSRSLHGVSNVHCRQRRKQCRQRTIGNHQSVYRRRRSGAAGYRERHVRAGNERHFDIFTVGSARTFFQIRRRIHHIRFERPELRSEIPAVVAKRQYQHERTCDLLYIILNSRACLWCYEVFFSPPLFNFAKFSRMRLILQLQYNYIVQNLTDNTLYELKVNGATNSYLGKSIIEGESSEPRTVYLHKECDSYNTMKNNHLIENTKSLLIGLCCVFGLLFVVAAVLFWQ